MKLTRTARRQIKKLAYHVGRITDTDRVFFEQHPHRKHRLRLASEVEIAQLELMNGVLLTLPPGKRYCAIVRNVAPGIRTRLIAPLREDEGTHVEEAFAHALYDEWSTRLGRDDEGSTRLGRDIEAETRRAFVKGDAA